MKTTLTIIGLLLATVANAQESITLHIDCGDGRPVADQLKSH